MEYAKLGNTNIAVSKLCIGCMSFGKAGTMHDWTLDEGESEKVISHALDLGISFFDTANCYSQGTSEEYLGKALKKLTQRDKVVIASKVYFNEGRLSKAAIEREIDGTLKRLGTDYLDLYIIHRFDYDTPIEETMEALDGLVKVGTWCVCNVWLSIPQYADSGEGQWLDTFFDYGKPLQSALQRGRKGTYTDMQADERFAHAVQSSCGRASCKATMAF